MAAAMAAFRDTVIERRHDVEQKNVETRAQEAKCTARARSVMNLASSADPLRFHRTRKRHQPHAHRLRARCGDRCKFAGPDRAPCGAHGSLNRRPKRRWLNCSSRARWRDSTCWIAIATVSTARRTDEPSLPRHDRLRGHDQVYQAFISRLVDQRSASTPFGGCSEGHPGLSLHLLAVLRVRRREVMILPRNTTPNARFMPAIESGRPGTR